MAAVDGNEFVWDRLFGCDPLEVAERVCAEYDPEAGSFRIHSFGQEFTICPEKRTVTCPSLVGRYLLSELDYFFHLSLLWYLVGCRKTPSSGELVKPEQLPGGQIFVKGTHVLPLAELAERYGRNKQGFVERGALLGGEPVEMADAAIIVKPFPRIGMTVTLWLADDEFDARTGLFFDATCAEHLAPDVVWSTAMTGLLLLLHNNNFEC